MWLCSQSNLCQVNGVFMQETFSVASSDDRVMIQKRNRLMQTHKLKMKRFFNLADKSQNGSIDMEPRHILNDLFATYCVLLCHIISRWGIRAFPLRRRVSRRVLVMLEQLASSNLASGLTITKNDSSNRPQTSPDHSGDKFLQPTLRS